MKLPPVLPSVRQLRSSAALLWNRLAHDSGAADYDSVHVEIYNPTEQARIASTLQELKDKLGKPDPDVLDFGAGTGNLARHWLALGARVTAADVSGASLEILRNRSPDTDRLRVVLLNGQDLAQFSAGSFDFERDYLVCRELGTGC